MSFSVPKKVYFDMIQIVCPIAPAKSSLQILSNIKMTVRSGIMRLAATDLDQSVSSSCEISGKDDFEVAVNARKIFDIVREIPDGNITGEMDGNVLILASEHGFSCKIAGADSNDFPAVPEVDDGVDFSVEKKNFSSLVNKSSFAVSRDTSRSCLCGVLWEIGPSGMTMVATDGHRLGCCSMKKVGKQKEKISVIVAPKTMGHVLKISEQFSENKILVSVGKKYILFKIGNSSICSKLIDGPYPDYEKVISRSNNKSAVVEKALLLDAVRRVSILSSQKTHLVKFLFKKDLLEIRVMNREIGGEAHDTIPITYEGEEHLIGFNGQFFSEIISIADSPKVRLEMNTQISACLVFPVSEKDEEPRSEDLFLIMPLRIMDEV